MATTRRLGRRSATWPDSVILRCLLDTAARGGQDRLILGGDVARRRYGAYGGMNGQDYLAKPIKLEHPASGSESVGEVLVLVLVVGLDDVDARPGSVNAQVAAVRSRRR
jgi:hypothetical protein